MSHIMLRYSMKNRNNCSIKKINFKNGILDGCRVSLK